MALPSKETLIFYDEVHPWVISCEKRNGVRYYGFSDDTPQTILDLFEEIKDKLSYPTARI